MFVDVVFRIFMYGIVIMIGCMLYRVIKGPSIYDRLNGIFVIGTDIIILLLLLGYADGRMDMYVDIALYYAFLGFISTIVIARFIRRRDRGDD
jgi:multicomponent Na+:H+ antiporter subunit F